MEKNTRKYTLLRTVGRFFSLIAKSFKAMSLTMFYSAVIIGISLAFYTTRYCGIGNIGCGIAISTAVSLIIAISVLGYLYDIYCTMFKNSVFKITDILKFDAAKIKSVGFLIAYIMCYVISGYISWKILQKPANPDWRIEFIYFTVFFVFCLVPIMAMRFSVVVAFYLNEQKTPSLKKLYDATEGRSYISIVGFLFVLLLLSVFNLYLSGAIDRVISSVSVVAGVLKIYLIILVLLSELSFILCFFEAQRQLITESMPPETDKEETEEKSVPVVERKTKKTSVKKKAKTKKKQK